MYNNNTLFAMEQLEKELLSILRSRQKEEQKILTLLIAAFPEQKSDIYQEYDRVIEQEFDIKVEMADSHIRIKLPAIMHRKQEYMCRLLYEQTLIRKLDDFRRKHDWKEIKYSSIIFEHVVCDFHNMPDNDNYNQSESKEILDAILLSGLIAKDNGTHCSISNITTIKEGDAPFTYVHLIDVESDKDFSIECSIRKESFEINRNYIIR